MKTYKFLLIGLSFLALTAFSAVSIEWIAQSVALAEAGGPAVLFKVPNNGTYGGNNIIADATIENDSEITSTFQGTVTVQGSWLDVSKSFPAYVSKSKLPLQCSKTPVAKCTMWWDLKIPPHTIRNFGRPFVTQETALGVFPNGLEWQYVLNGQGPLFWRSAVIVNQYMDAELAPQAITKTLQPGETGLITWSFSNRSDQDEYYTYSMSENPPCWQKIGGGGYISPHYTTSFTATIAASCLTAGQDFSTNLVYTQDFAPGAGATDENQRLQWEMPIVVHVLAVATATPTNTPVPPSATPSATATPTVDKVATLPPLPTATVTPTLVVSATPVSTAPVPTSTSAPTDSWEQKTVPPSFGVIGRDVSWYVTITNTNVVTQNFIAIFDIPLPIGQITGTASVGDIVVAHQEVSPTLGTSLLSWQGYLPPFGVAHLVVKGHVREDAQEMSEVSISWNVVGEDGQQQLVLIRQGRKYYLPFVAR